MFRGKWDSSAPSLTASPEDAPQDIVAEAQFTTDDTAFQDEDVVDLSTPDPDGEFLPADEEFLPSEGGEDIVDLSPPGPSASFDGITIAYPSNGKTVNGASVHTAGDTIPQDESRRLHTTNDMRQQAAKNDEPHKATMADANEMKRKAIRRMAMEQAAELARNRGIPTTPKAPDVLELEMPE